MLYKKELANRIIGAAIEVHRSLGPGLLESAYQSCLAHEFNLCGIEFEQEKALPVVYKIDPLAGFSYWHYNIRHL